MTENTVKVGDCFYDPDVQALYYVQGVDGDDADCRRIAFGNRFCQVCDLFATDYVARLPRAKAIHVYTADGGNHGFGLTPETEEGK